MSAIPNDWTISSVGELCKLVNGRAFKPSDWTKAGLPIVRIQNLNNPEAPFNYYNGEVKPQFLINDGELLFAWSGTPGTSFGAHIWNGGRAVLNQHIFKVLFDPSKVDRLFLRIAINQKLDELIEKAHGGVGLRHVTKGKFEETVIALPALTEQRRIVAKLDSLLARSKTARVELMCTPRLADRLQQAIIDSAFGGALTSAVPIGRTIRSLIKSLDQGWSPKCLSRPADGGEWAVIKTTAIQAVRFDPSENKALPSSLPPRATLQIAAGDVLVTRAGPRSRVGICSIVHECPPRLMLCDKAYRLRVDSELAESAYLALALNSPRVLARIESLKTGISDSGLNLTQSKFLDLEIPWVPPIEQRFVVNALERRLRSLEQIRQDSSRAMALLDRMDQSILFKAFRGELLTAEQDLVDSPSAVKVGPEHVVA